jgi:hypothetical protein
LKAADRAGPGSGLNPNISAGGTAQQASRMKMFTEAVSGAVIVNNWSRDMDEKYERPVYSMENRRCGDQEPHRSVLHGRHRPVRLDGALPLRQGSGLLPAQQSQDGVGLILPGMQCIKTPWAYPRQKVAVSERQDVQKACRVHARVSTRPAQSCSYSWPPASAVPWPSTDWMVKLLKNDLLNKLASPIVDMQYSCASASATPNRWYDENVKSRPHDH